MPASLLGTVAAVTGVLRLPGLAGPLAVMVATAFLAALQIELRGLDAAQHVEPRSDVVTVRPSVAAVWGARPVPVGLVVVAAGAVSAALLGGVALTTVGAVAGAMPPAYAAALAAKLTAVERWQQRTGRELVVVSAGGRDSTLASRARD